MGRPLMRLFDKLDIKGRKIPSWFSALVVLIVYLVVLVMFFEFLIPILSKQVEIIVGLDVDALLQEFNQPIVRIENWFKSMNINGVNRDEIRNQIVQYTNFSHLSDLFQGILSGLGSLLIGFMSVLFITFFLLKDRQIVNNIIDTLTPDKYLTKVHNIIEDTKDLLTRYFIGVAIQISIITAIVTIGLKIVGVDNALLIGFAAGIINIIPYLGPIIGATFGVALTLLTQFNGDINPSVGPLILKVLMVFSTAQLVDNFVLQPLIFSKSVKAHPLEIFVVIMVAGMIAGVVGMILAVPAYTFLRIVAKEFFQGYKVVQGLTKDL